MKCEDARELIQSLLDGECCSNIEQAHKHIAGCADCREWKAGMDAIMTAAGGMSDDVPDINISEAVMARLPERHPAGVENAWTPARLLVWTAVCWVVGFALIATAFSAWMLYTGTSFASLPALVFDFGKSVAVFIVSTAAGAITFMKTIASSASSLIMEILRFAVRMRLFILLSMVADVLLIIACYGIWRRRKAVVVPLGVIF
ncbi:MAG: hypothetical protein ABFD49_01330 [Armatimonadota bacterium]|nr:zf-HC2 domain-containing protein [bacterium]